MKISTLFLLISLLQVSAKSYSQSVTIDYSENGITVLDIFNRIEKSTDYSILYKENDIKSSQTVDVNYKNRSVEDILDEILTPLNLTYNISDRLIVIKKSAPIAQKIDGVDGVVFDSEGNPLTGATVVIKGTTIGQISNQDGKFSFKSIESDAIITISFIGMKSIDIPLNGKSNIEINMQIDAFGLDEVVAVGYGTQKKANLTGAVSSVGSKSLESRPITNLGQGLQGLIPNLNITQSSGRPGKGSDFNVRGTTSINGGGPLVLIDGVQMDPNLINPDDIDNISVLKDAASASIYGARAAYGVILITTKSGSKNQGMKFTYRGNVSINKPTRLPEYVNSLDFVNMMNIASKNTGSGVYFNDEYVQHVENYLANPTPENAVFIDPNNSDKYLYCGNTDWIDAIYKDASTNWQHTFGMTGGTAKTSYYISLGVLDQGGFMEFFDEKFKRYNTNINVKSDINKWLTISAKSKLNNTNQLSPYGSQWSDGSESSFIAGDLRPLMPVYHPDGNFSGQGSWTNQAALCELSGTRERKINDIWLTGAIQLRPLDGLIINGDYTYNFYSNVNSIHKKEITEHYANPDRVSIYPWTTPSSAAVEQSDDYYRALNIFGEYQRQIGLHDMKITAGFNQEEKENRSTSLSRDNLINNDFGAPNQAVGEDNISYGASDWAIRGAFSRINYIFADRYLLELNGRYDGSSKFPSKDRFKFFPSVSAGWRVSEEAFFKPATALFSNLKLRASYGTLGNQNVDSNYPYIASLGSNSNSGYIIDGEQPVSITPAGLVSDNLTWETVKQANFGVDFSMLSGRLGGSFDWYNRMTEDMLTSGQKLPATIGTGVPKENAADLKTIGWELAINWQDRIGKDISYSAGLVLSDSQGEITKFENPAGLISEYYVGRKINEIWGYTSDGLFQSDEEVASSASQSDLWGGNWAAGDVKYRDIDGDEAITDGNSTLDNSGDRSIIGNSTSRYSFGVNGGLKWKALSFNCMFQGVAKKEYMPGGNYFWGLTSEWAVPQQHSLDYWTEDNKDAYWFRPRFGQSGNYQTQTRYIQNAAYIRLKQVNLTYNIPSDILDKFNVDKMSIYFNGENLWEYSKIISSYDPEVLNAATYPLQRSFSFGVNLTL